MGAAGNLARAGALGVPSLRTILLGGAGVAAASSATGTIGRLLENRFLALNRPTWEQQGQAKLYGQHGGTARYVRGQETLLKGMFDLPYDVIKQKAPGVVDRVLDAPKEMYDRYRLNKVFDEITDDPNVQELGRAKAKRMFKELSRIAPETLRKAPHTAVPAIQTAVMTQSMGLRPDYIMPLARTEKSMF